MLWRFLQLFFVGVLLVLGAVALFLDLLGYAEAIEKNIPWLGRFMKRRDVLFALLLFAIAFLMKDFHDAVAIAPPPDMKMAAIPAPQIVVSQQLGPERRSRSRASEPPQGSSGSAGASIEMSRHLTQVQVVRLRRLFSEIGGALEFRVESVASDVEAMQYANEINDVLNESKHTKFQVIRGLSWARVPQGVLICLHSEQNATVKSAAEKVAQEMITMGIPVLYNANESWPDNCLIIVVGSKPIT